MNVDLISIFDFHKPYIYYDSWMLSMFVFDEARFDYQIPITILRLK